MQIPRRILLALIASMVTMGLPVQVSADGPRPKILLNLVVEGLDDTQLDMLRQYFGKDGFDRLLRDGVCLTADYGTALDPTAASALVMSGTSPSVNGITGTKRYDRRAKRSQQLWNDPAVMGNFTQATYSPQVMSVGTISDEVRIAGAGTGSVYAIAPEPEQALALGGHAANCALWIDDTNGNWATSTYYTEVPAMLIQRNRTNHLTQRLDTMSWTPMYGVERYPGLPRQLTQNPFCYYVGRNVPYRFATFKNTPALVNREITSLAIDLIQDQQLGTRGGMDMVSVAYTVNPYSGSRKSDTRYEHYDTYYRLDADIARLIAAAERQSGRGNCAVMLTGLPAASTARRDDERWRVPYGEFSTRKAVSLLNVYLIALHGNGEWVTAYDAGWVYLNNKLIEDRRLDEAQLRREAADFLSRMAGVKAAFTIDDIRAGRAGDDADALKRNTHYSTAGDMLVEVMPGWQVIDDANVPGATSDPRPMVQRSAAAAAPVVLMVPSVPATVVNTPVDARIVAPTMCRLLRIRSPNASELPSLRL